MKLDWGRGRVHHDSLPLCYLVVQFHAPACSVVAEQKDWHAARHSWPHPGLYWEHHAKGAASTNASGCLW